MMYRRMGRGGWPTLAVALAPGGAVAGSLDRLKSVSEHARRQAEGGPDHLWVGIGVAALGAVVVGLAAWWALARRRR